MLGVAHALDPIIKGVQSTDGIRMVSGWYPDGILAAAPRSGSSAQGRASATGPSAYQFQSYDTICLSTCFGGAPAVLVLQLRGFAVVLCTYCANCRSIFFWNQKRLIASLILVAIQLEQELEE